MLGNFGDEVVGCCLVGLLCGCSGLVCISLR